MIDDLLRTFQEGDTLSASRVMSIVERRGDDAEVVLSALHGRTGRCERIGITGGTGSGKSTLIAGLATRYRGAGRTVGVIAEDPTSPFSGGAILGDRIRIHRAAGDDGLFVRSVASRGSETGFSPLAAELADVLDAFGRDVILLETIGIGQLEFRIRHVADTTVVVLTPESGDEVQTLKSGLMEIGDVFVVNKADRPGAEGFAADVESALELRGERDGWHAPVISTVAVDDRGLEGLAGAIERHREWLARDGRLERRRREGMAQRLRALAEEKLSGVFWGNRYIEKEFGGIFEEVMSGRLSPHAAAAKLVNGFAGTDSGGSGRGTRK